MKANIIYWSGTGNTESLANDISSSLEAKYEVNLESVLNKDSNYDYDLFLLGCPACGAEQLSDDFDAFWQDNKDKFANKKVALFGCFDWGDGEWIRVWEDDAKSNNIDVVATFPVNMADLGSVDVSEFTSQL